MTGRPRRPKASTAEGAVPDAEAAAPTSTSSTQAEGAVVPKRRRRRRRTRKRKTGSDPTAAAALVQPKPTSSQKKQTKQKKQPKSPTKAELAARATSTRKEVSSGGVVYRRSEDGSFEILLAARRTLKGNIAWGLAKGHIEEGESPEEAAVREVREETGFEAVIDTSLGVTKYFYVWENVRIRKTVHFFLMHPTHADAGDRDDEMEEIRWFTLERAIKRAAYRGERDVLLRAAEILG